MQASYLNMEDVIKKTVEFIIQQHLDSILQIGLSFFVMFTSIQTQYISHEYLDGIKILMEADLSQCNSNSPVHKTIENQENILNTVPGDSKGWREVLISHTQLQGQKLIGNPEAVFISASGIPTPSIVPRC